MKKIKFTDVEPHGMPLYEMRDLFGATGNYKKVSMCTVTILPGHRIPTTGFSCHKEDEYSYIISGELEAFCGGEYFIHCAGEASLIPRGEEHWCINKKDEPCHIVCFMVE